MPARFDSYDKAIGAGWKAPNEVRRLEGLPPSKVARRHIFSSSEL
jgi:phage portal protein BeeE